MPIPIAKGTRRECERLSGAEKGKTMREKLIDLCEQANDELRLRAGCSTWGDFVDILIANGVTIPVRCKECTHSSNNGLPDDRVFCRLLSKYMDVDGFCHNGERRTDETKTD